jgi:hypothetical protein
MIYVFALTVLALGFLLAPAVLGLEGWSPMQHLLSKTTGVVILLTILPNVILSRVLQFKPSHGY